MLCCWCKWWGQCKAWYAFEMPHEGGFWQLSTATILQQWEYLNAAFVNVRPKFLMQCGLDEVAHQRMGFSRWVVVQLSKGNILTYITSDGKGPLSVGVGFRRYCLWKKSCTSWDRSKHDKIYNTLSQRDIILVYYFHWFRILSISSTIDASDASKGTLPVRSVVLWSD